MEHHADTPATRGDDRPLTMPPLPSSDRRTKKEVMGDLLAAVTALNALMQREDDEGTPVQRPGTSSAATSRAWETGRTQAAQAAAILNSGRETASANLQDPPTALNTDIALKKGLPSSNNSQLLVAAPQCHKFVTQRRGEAETPLAFRSALLALAKSAYPGMDQVSRDSLVLKKMLQLARELQILLPATDDDVLSSLRIAWCLEAHFSSDLAAGILAVGENRTSQGT
ncbi:unnamed protein product [Lampetra fluviatilis]